MALVCSSNFLQVKVTMGLNKSIHKKCPHKIAIPLPLVRKMSTLAVAMVEIQRIKNKELFSKQHIS